MALAKLLALCSATIIPINCHTHTSPCPQHLLNNSTIKVGGKKLQLEVHGHFGHIFTVSGSGADNSSEFYNIIFEVSS